MDTFELVPILKKLPLTVESMTTWGDWLAVGTKEGHILGYYIASNNQKIFQEKGEDLFEPELKNTARGISKKPIIQMAVSTEFRLLFALTDGELLVHNLDQLTPTDLSIRNRACHLFAISVTTEDVGVRQLTLCLAEKKRLVFFFLSGKGGPHARAKERTWEHLGEQNLTDSARCVVWNKECDAVFVGVKKEYFFVPVKSSLQIKEIFPLGHVRSEPLVKNVDNDEVAICKDDKTHFLSSHGQPSRKYTISWGDIPLDFIYSYPYYVALLNKMIEVRAVEDTNPFRIQTLMLPESPKCIVNAEHAYVASAQFIWRLEPIAIHRQLKTAIQSKHFSVGLLLAEMLEGTPEEKKGQVLHIKRLQAFSLFTQHEFEQSLEKYSQIQADPIDVISLYPKLLPDAIRLKRKHPAEPPPLTGKDLSQAMDVLTQYLMQQRNLYKEKLKPGETDTPTIDMLQIIDTTLLKCYAECNESLIGPLVRLKDNYLFLVESERILKRKSKLPELIQLYNTKGEHKKSLNLLMSCHHQSQAPLCGPAHTIDYLQKLGPNHLPLILQFSKWVLGKTPEEGLKIFTEDIQEVEYLDREIVLDFIKNENKGLVIPYLKAIMINWGETKSHFHNELVLCYKSEVLRLLEPYKGKKFEERPKAGQEPGGLGSIRRELISFLENSQHYKPEKLISSFPQGDLYEERALLLGRLERHEPALAIYAYILRSPSLAEDYCEKNYPHFRDIYLLLMKMYLITPDLEKLGIESPRRDKLESNMKSALALLSKYHEVIDTSQVLNLLPPDTPLRDLQVFLTSVLEKKSKERRTNQVTKSLIFAQHVQVQRERIRSEGTFYHITDDTICDHCKKKLGDSAFAWNANNGSIVHYYCWDANQIKQERAKNPGLNS
ncbi:hypothetical protein LOD99_7260 [Oopsacas minuta]|uniref:CNH domain-containing protein n=1 Tax=Oopsacas minuta TaxID=111878 RepID=A0AAV7JTC7_9METZ|nr:hypothetical protein LOD99_7260 [Oopsacas minuta]